MSWQYNQQITVQSIMQLSLWIKRKSRLFVNFRGIVKDPRWLQQIILIKKYTEKLERINNLLYWNNR